MLSITLAICTPGREDLGKAGLELAVELCALLHRYADQLSEGIEGLAAALGDVAGQVVHVGDHELVQLRVARKVLRLIALRGARGDAEGLVAIDAVGRRLECLEQHLVVRVVLEQHGAETAARVRTCLSGRECRSDQD